eukprot:1807522-Amphidinium_carterae.1
MTISSKYEKHSSKVHCRGKLLNKRLTQESSTAIEQLELARTPFVCAMPVSVSRRHMKLCGTKFSPCAPKIR